MTKLTNAGAVTRVSASQIRRPIRRVDPAWEEFADHFLAEKLPVVTIGVELARCPETGRIPFRAILLIAALAI